MEMFSALMDNLHEDLNRVRKKPVTEPVEDKSRPDDVVAKEAWEVYVVFEREAREFQSFHIFMFQLRN